MRSFDINFYNAVCSQVAQLLTSKATKGSIVSDSGECVTFTIQYSKYTTTVTVNDTVLHNAEVGKIAKVLCSALNYRSTY